MGDEASRVDPVSRKHLTGQTLGSGHVAGNPGLDPFTIAAGSQQVVSWQCPNDLSHIWTARIITRTARRTGCPFCANRRASATNSLAAVFPAVAAEWHPKKNGALTPEQVTHGSNKMAWWRCPKGHVYQTRIASRTGLGTGCSKCAGSGRRRT